VIIFHGESDERVGVDQSEKLAEKLKEYEFISYPDEGHKMKGRWDDVNKRIFDWFEKT